jgi:CRISPR-associated protein (TIGR03984 family)
MVREQNQVSSSTQPLTVNSATDDLRDWLTTQATTYKLNWLLAHCDDGVIWGQLRDNILALSSDQTAFPKDGMDLRWETLQQARLFGAAGEIFLWPGPSDMQGKHTWKARLLYDSAGNPMNCIDEEYLLWGYAQNNEQPPLREGFMQITEGSQGIVHAPPIGADKPSEKHRARLQVRHYLEEGDTGIVRISYSRLVALMKPGE